MAGVAAQTSLNGIAASFSWSEASHTPSTGRPRLLRNAPRTASAEGGGQQGRRRRGGGQGWGIDRVP